MDSTPARRFRQNASTSGAPGKRPDIPMMAIPAGAPAAPRPSSLILIHPRVQRLARAPAALRRPLLERPVFDGAASGPYHPLPGQIDRQGAHRRVAEQLQHGHWPAQGLLQLALDLYQEQRMAPQFEEVVES